MVFAPRETIHSQRLKDSAQPTQLEIVDGPSMAAAHVSWFTALYCQDLSLADEAEVAALDAAVVSERLSMFKGQ